MSVYANGKVYETVADFAEQEFGTPREQITPEWNIERYTKLLSYTKKTVKRKKLQEELNWWLEAKEFDEDMKRLREEREEA